jgi:CBS domain-containing protein
MNASEVMTREVVSVSPDTPVREVARTLLAHGISAVPVVNAQGLPIGMLSEGDLVMRDERSRLARHDWWLKLIADDTEQETDFLARLRASERTAADVMVAPVVTVGEETGLAEIAGLLAQHHIKRVPVLKDGCITGIVSRADLLRALVSDRPDAAVAAPKHGLLDEMFQMIVPHHQAVGPGDLPDKNAAPAAAAPALSATTFRGLVQDFHAGEMQEQDAARRAAAEQRQRLAEELINTHVLDETWQATLHRAREAAAAGAKQYLLLRFPNALCTDGGRAINIGEESWPTTLRGEPAELYLRWERDLKGSGFGIAAQVLEFPGGKPGDIGLFLEWGEQP